MGDQYNAFLDGEEITDISQVKPGDVIVNTDGKTIKPVRLPSNLFQFKKGTGVDRVVLDCITSLQNGADLLWIETEKPHIGQIAEMVNKIRETIPNAKLRIQQQPLVQLDAQFPPNKYLILGKKPAKMYPLTTVPS